MTRLEELELMLDRARYLYQKTGFYEYAEDVERIKGEIEREGTRT